MLVENKWFQNVGLVETLETKGAKLLNIMLRLGTSNSLSCMNHQKLCLIS